MAEINLIGLGYVGLPAAIMFAGRGHRVRGVDTDPAVVEAVRSGHALENEPGVPSLLRAALASGRLTVEASPAPADVFVIAVPTPVRADRSPDLSYVLAACRAVAGYLAKGNLVVIESTISPGATVNAIAAALGARGLRAGPDFSLAHCPERVLPGNVIEEITGNDRIIGGVDPLSTARAVELYESFVEGELRPTDATTAEMVKLAENTYRDVNIALSNTLANVAETVGVSVWEVVELANLHPRVDLHRPGPGVGGHCIPVDPWFLAAADEASTRLIRAAREVNDGQPGIIARLALRLAGVSEPRIAVLGVAYKPGVSDTRDSPAASLVGHLREAGASVAVHDPRVRKFAPAPLPLDEAVRGADLAIVMVGHPEYARVEPGDIGGLMRSRRVLDACNALDATAWVRAGFDFRRYGSGTP